MENGGPELDPMLAARVRVPPHVVYRDFGEETVILNLDSGTYHGLNQTAATMHAVLGESDSVAKAIETLQERFDVDRDVLERDVLKLCHDLVERNLIEQDAAT